MIKKILAIAWKDTIVQFSSRTHLLFMLFLPILFTFLLGNSLSTGAPEAGADNRILLPIVSEDHGALSAALLAELRGSTTVKTTLIPRADAETLFADEDAPALLIIPAGFSAAILNGEMADLDLQTAPRNSNGDIVAQAVETAVFNITSPIIIAQQSVVAAEGKRPFVDAAAKEAYFQQALLIAKDNIATAPEQMIVTQPPAAPEANDGFDIAAHQSAGQLITWVFIPLLGISGLFAFERTQGTLRRLLTTPARKSTFLLGTITGQFGASLVQMTLLVLFGVFVMKVNWGNSVAGLALILFTFGLAGVALGTMLGTFVKTDSQASNISIMAGMSMALLGGCWFPLELFPPGVQTAVHILPTTWAMQGLTDLVLRGQGFSDILLEATALFGFAVVFFIIGVKRFRYE